MTEVNTYVDEMFLRFILGTEPLSEFDAYVERIKRMNIQEVIDIENAAIARYDWR